MNKPSSSPDRRGRRSQDRPAGVPFRAAATPRTYSPDELDQVLQPTNPRGWLTLGALVILLTSSVAWSVLGRVFDKVQGRGILVRSGGVLEVVAPAEGRVADIAVSVGDSVSEGQVVARLVQPELAEELKTARSLAASARLQYEQLVAFKRNQTQLEHHALAQQQADLDASVRNAEANLASLRKRLEAQQTLLEQGLVTQMTLLAARQQVDQKADEIRRGRSDLAQLRLRQSDADNRRAEEAHLREVTVAEAEANVARLDRQLAIQSEVVSPFTGRILELLVEQGGILVRGEAIMTLDLTGRAVQDLVAIAYVPSVYGKMIEPGMRIHIAPSTVRREEFGMMVGVVTFVSDYPSTTKGMLRVLKNEKLVQELSGEGAPYEVHASLIPDPATVSKFAWSSSKGPPLRIESGTLANTVITVREQRPAELVLPVIRRWITP